MKVLIPLLKLYLFWLIFFLFQQAIFLGFHYSDSLPFAESLGSFYTGLRLNLSTIAYLVALPLLLQIAHLYGLSERFVNTFTRYFTALLIVLSSIILCSDISLFEVWGTKLNAKALGYLKYPKELAPTVFNAHNTLLFFLIAIQIGGGLWFYRKMRIGFEPVNMKWVPKLAFSLLLPALLVVGFRGGIQKVPINRNQVFQSGHAVLNYASLNSFWNLVNLISKPIGTEGNPYHFYDDALAEQVVASAFSPSSNLSQPILNTTRPNVVLIFLESWAADEIACLGGEAGVTPRFDSLLPEGLLFTRFYSTGYRTEQGYLATLSASPALPVGSVIHSFGSFDKLPNVYRELGKAGYHTSFYSGGRLFFDNIEAYLRSAGAHTLKGENEWSFSKRTVWGAYDEALFAFHLREMDAMKPPFFTVATTMTTHEWFDADVPKVFHSDPDPVNDNYRNTMHYADSCLYAYLQDAKKHPWYDNTLFVIVADHACKFPRGRSNDDPERHHIPLLLTGGALKKNRQGKQLDIIGTHADLPATLLHQLGLGTTSFPNSKDLLDTDTARFAYYAFDNGFGIITKQGNLIYDHNRGITAQNSFTDSLVSNYWLKFGKSYLQCQFQHNLDLATQNQPNRK